MEAKPLRPDGRVARPDKNAQERALDYGTVVYAERERREPLPSGQLRSGPENNRQLAGRDAARKRVTLQILIFRDEVDY